MTLEVFDCEQGSPEWFELHKGIPTSSNFSLVMASGKGGEPSVTRTRYMYQLAATIITDKFPVESFSNEHTERGHAMEPDARRLYAFMTDTEPKQIGFSRNGRTGCSPDAVIGEKGLLEIKTKLPHLMIETMLKDEFPAVHKAQCQGALWIMGREWIDLVVYWPDFPPFIKRATRDEPYISKMADAIDAFNEELDEVVAKVLAKGEFSL